MLKVEVELAEPADVLERLYPDGQLGGFVVDGPPVAPLGARVQLLIRVRAFGGRHFAATTQVAWARHRGSRSLKECFGLNFLPGDKDTRGRLLAFAQSALSGEHLREAERAPVEWPVVLIHRGAERRERLADLSVSGAYVATLRPLVAGTEVEMQLRPPGSLRRMKLPARVAWARKGGDRPGMGLDFSTNDARLKERVRKLVQKLLSGP